MDGLTFTAEVLKALAWPLAAVTIFLVLRKPIRDLLPFIQKLKWKEVEIEFGRQVKEIRAELAQDLPQAEAEALTRPSDDAVLRLAEVSPRAAVLEAWREVELAALEAARRIAGDNFRNRTLTYDAIRTLERSELVDRSILGSLRELRALRNQAAHAPEFAISKEAAFEYGRSGRAVAEYLKRMQPAA